MVLAGIDYGSKKAGTTVIASFDGSELKWSQSKKNEDADTWLQEKIMQLQPEVIGIDAPLSLPQVYRNQNENGDFFFRECDRQLKAMSPMFLGGLTARAMQLNRNWTNAGIKVIETYPKKIGELLEFDELRYKKDPSYPSECFNCILQETNWFNEASPENWHQTDALLALFGAYRYFHGMSNLFGNLDEGFIYI